MKIKAFTLAEVLLTLAIIGVIAAVTIPALNSSNQDKKFLALTKKALVTLQGATDAKISLTSSVPRNNNTFFEWLTDEGGVAGGGNDEDTIKTVCSAANAAMTPDAMGFLAITNYVGGLDNRFKNRGVVYVDLNGAEGPTQTRCSTLDELQEAARNPQNFDIVCFTVDEQGTFTPNCAENTNATQYLKM